MTAPIIMERYRKEYIKARRRIPDRRTELEYVRLAVEGNRAAKQTLIYKYIPFLYAMAIKIRHVYSSTTDELVNSAIFGFDKALREFNQTRGTSFYTYFVPKAYNEMNKERFGSLLVKRSEAKLKKQRDEELETVSCVSIDKLDQDGHSLVESLIDNTDESTDWLAQFNDLTTLTDEFMKELPPVEKRIVAEIYINNPEGSTLNEVGTELGMCRERVRQLKNRALERMRKSQLFEDIADKTEVA